jgi:hypothetical protein
LAKNEVLLIEGKEESAEQTGYGIVNFVVHIAQWRDDDN